MPDLKCYVAVIGRLHLTPGILPIDSQGVECLVAHSFPKTIEDPARDITLDISNCTLFTLTYIGQGTLDITQRAVISEIFERSIFAISEVTVWTKSKEQIGSISAFMRQIGIVDVKVFFATGVNDVLVGWINPAFGFARDSAALIAAFLPNMIVRNGPAANPIPFITRRVMNSLDLINLGFYTESFVNLFSLTDDLIQDVVKAGMKARNLKKEEQKNLLRAIKEERFKFFLTGFLKLCGWKSLQEDAEELYKRVLEVNNKRNQIMHGSLRLTRADAIEASNTLLTLIDWLRGNPFGFGIPAFPYLHTAEPVFSIFPLKDSQSSNAPSDQNTDNSVV